MARVAYENLTCSVPFCLSCNCLKFISTRSRSAHRRHKPVDCEWSQSARAAPARCRCCWQHAARCCRDVTLLTWQWLCAVCIPDWCLYCWILTPEAFIKVIISIAGNENYNRLTARPYRILLLYPFGEETANHHFKVLCTSIIIKYSYITVGHGNIIIINK